MDKNQHICTQKAVPLPPGTPFPGKNKTKIIGFSQHPDVWWKTLATLFKYLAAEFDLKQITHLALDATSGTVLLADRQGKPLTPALMYNDQRAVIEAQIIAQFAPEETAAIGAASGLAKLLWLMRATKGKSPDTSIRYFLNQADWLLGKLSGRFGFSDMNNALKMGYDAINQCWPAWLLQMDLPGEYFPEVYPPGTVVGKILPPLAETYGFHPELNLCAGTTDSTAAIIASGATSAGEAVTSLGSSLVMKVISKQPVFNRQYGIYSQPLNNDWLVGGASNSGGEVLKAFFSLEQMDQMSNELMHQMRAGQFSYLNLNYYPLLNPGERFPILDPHLPPQLEPRPAEDRRFFQALLEGMADIETASYQRLLELGAPYPKLIRSIGGGAKNPVWCKIREYKTGVPVKLAEYDQAAAGAAILAQTEWQDNEYDSF